MTAPPTILAKASAPIVSGALLFVGLLFQQLQAAEPPITAIAVAPNSTAVVVGSQAGIELRSWPALTLDERIPCELEHVNDLAFSPDSKFLAAAGGTPGELGALAVYSWPERKLVASARPHNDLIYAIAWSADGRHLATASGDRRVGVLWCDLKQSPTIAVERMLESHSRGVLAVNFLQPRERLISGGMDETVRLWDVSSGTVLRSLTNHTRPVVALAVQPSPGDAPPLVASAGADRTVRFWQPMTGRLVRFARLDSPPQAIAWTPDGKSLWAATFDGRVRQINPNTAEVTNDLPATKGPAYSLAVAGDDLLVGGGNGELARVPPPKQADR